MSKIANQCIRGLDYDLYQQARQAAVKQRITMGELFNRAIHSYLKDTEDQEAHQIAEKMEDVWKSQRSGAE